MKLTLQMLRNLLGIILLIIRNLPFLIIKYICLKTLYWVTYEEGNINGILSERKYRRIKQSIRYKLWVWYNMRWLCNMLDIDFSCYEPYYKNKKILRY